MKQLFALVIAFVLLAVPASAQSARSLPGSASVPILKAPSLGGASAREQVPTPTLHLINTALSFWVDLDKSLLPGALPAGLGLTLTPKLDGVAVTGATTAVVSTGYDVTLPASNFSSIGIRSLSVSVKWNILDATKFRCGGPGEIGTVDPLPVDCTEVESAAVSISVGQPTVPKPLVPIIRIKTVTTAFNNNGDVVSETTVEMVRNETTGEWSVASAVPSARKK